MVKARVFDIEKLQASTKKLDDLYINHLDTSKIKLNELDNILIDMMTELSSHINELSVSAAGKSKVLKWIITLSSIDADIQKFNPDLLSSEMKHKRLIDSAQQFLGLDKDVLHFIKTEEDKGEMLRQKFDENSYGYKAAVKKQFEKEQQEQQASMKKPEPLTAKPKVRTPNLDWKPMSHANIKLPKHKIDWSDEGTTTHATYLANRFLNDSVRMQLLKMPAGTGKTAVTVKTLGLMQEMTHKTIPFVVTAPSKVADGLGWQSTILSWNQSHPKNQLKPLLVTSLDRFKETGKDPKSIVKIYKALGDNGIIIMDEIQKYKNPSGMRNKQMQKYRSFKMLGLSATPITNDPIMDAAAYLILAGYYHSKNDFLIKENLRSHFRDDGSLDIYDNNNQISETVWPEYKRFRRRLADMMYQPNIEIIDLDMPFIRKHIIQLEASSDLQSKLRSLAIAQRRRMFDSFMDYYMEILKTISLDENRIKKTLEIINDKKTIQPLIFYRHTAVKDSLTEVLDAHNIHYQIISGGNSIKDVDLDATGPILVQYTSGAEGIEMKNSNTTIFYENQQSFAILVQAQGRNVRRGMREDASHELSNQYFLISDAAVDQQMFDVLQDRQSISTKMLEEIVDEGMKL